MADDRHPFIDESISSAGIRRAAALLWPDWVELEGCVLRREVADPDNVRRWLETDDGSQQQTESALNHVHLYDYVDSIPGEPEDEFDQRLHDVAERMARAWRASLMAAFPSKTFRVQVASGDGEYGPTVYAHSEPAAVERS